jgi:hypothetical protein
VADLFDAQHIDAGLSLLRADASLTVYPDAEGNVPAAVDMASEYVRVHTAIERPTGISGAANRLDGLSSTAVVRWYCDCVGPNEYASLAVGMRVRAALLDQIPVIAGRTCGPIRQEAAAPTTRSEVTGIPVYDRVYVYRMQTSPG